MRYDAYISIFIPFTVGIGPKLAYIIDADMRATTLFLMKTMLEKWLLCWMTIRWQMKMKMLYVQTQACIHTKLRGKRRQLCPLRTLHTAFVAFIISFFAFYFFCWPLFRSFYCTHYSNRFVAQLPQYPNSCSMHSEWNWKLSSTPAENIPSESVYIRYIGYGFGSIIRSSSSNRIFKIKSLEYHCMQLCIQNWTDSIMAACFLVSFLFSCWRGFN